MIAIWALEHAPGSYADWPLDYETGGLRSAPPEEYADVETWFVESEMGMGKHRGAYNPPLRGALVAFGLTGLLVSGCGEPSISAALLVGDADSQCVWGEEPDGQRYQIALPRGWTASTDPVAIYDPDGNAVVEAGAYVEGAPARVPWESGDVLCEVDGAGETLRFRDVYPSSPGAEPAD